MAKLGHSLLLATLYHFWGRSANAWAKRTPGNRGKRLTQDNLLRSCVYEIFVIAAGL